MKFNFKKILPHLVAVLVAVILSSIYFKPQLEGKTTISGDGTAYLGASKELTDYSKKTGDVSMWAPSVFSGMPSYHIKIGKNTNYLSYVQKLIQLFIPRPIGYFVFGMLAFYLALVLMSINPWLSLFGAIGFGMSTYSMVLYDAGHFNKVMSIMSMMPIIAGMILVFRKKYINGSILFAIGLGINLYSFHIQMTYYLAMMLFVYVVFELVDAIKSKETAHFLKAIGFLVVASVLALSTSASRLLTNKEYTEDTMRGKPVLVADSNDATKKTGLDWDYSMAWSNGLLDLFATYIPGVVGGSSNEQIDKSSATAKEFRKFGQRATSAPLYWGALSSTSGPAYYGAIMMLLFVLSFFVLKRKLKWGIGTGVLLGIILSLGSNFEFFNRIIFDYFPLYNKFRAHSSIMSVIIVLVVFMGVMGLVEIVNATNKKKYLKKIFIAMGILSAISLFFALLGGSFFDFEAASDARYAAQGFNADVFVADRQSMMRSDAIRSLIFVLLGGGLLVMYVKEKLKLNVLLPLLIFLSVVDMWGVDKRYLNEADFVSKSKTKNQFVQTPADKEILKDPDPYYRVFNQTVNSFNDNTTSYWHHSVGGYSAAKLRRYQDIIERHLSKNNRKVFNMLNTKYFIVPDNNKQPRAQQNPEALGNAWFVSHTKMVNTANEEIDALNDTDVKSTAIIHKEFSNYVGNIQPSQNGSIKLESFTPNHLTYRSSNGVDALAVFSEVWYGPDKGWKTLVDGSEVDMIRANYILRAVKIPAGQHKIEMIFDPSSFKIGNMISMISSLLLILLGGWVVFKEVRGE